MYLQRVTEHGYPKPIKKTLKSHTASLGDKEFYNEEHGQRTSWKMSSRFRAGLRVYIAEHV